MSRDPSSSPLVRAPVVIVLERALWSPGPEWHLAVEHVAARFRRVAVLDVEATLAAGDLAAQLESIDEWALASGAAIDVDVELSRFFDQHLTLHLRPDASRTRALRAAAVHGELHGASALPESAAASIARHAGVLRSLTSLTGSVRTTLDHERLRERLGAGRTVSSLDELDAPPA